MKQNLTLSEYLSITLFKADYASLVNESASSKIINLNGTLELVNEVLV